MAHGLGIGIGNHALLSATHEDVTTAAVAVGALIFGGSDTTWQRLVVGTDGQVLTADTSNTAIAGAVPVWAAASGGNLGDTVALASEVSGTLPIANGGTGQTAQEAAFDALSPTTTQGDLILRGDTDNIRLAKGTSNQFLRMNDTSPNWETVTLGDTDHGAIGGLTDDDHTQYVLLAGRSSGQTIHGGSAASEDLILSGTSNTAPGTVFVEDSDAFEIKSRGDTTPAELRLREPGSSTNVAYVGFKAPALAGSNVYLLPTAFPTDTAKQILQSDTDGTMAWVTTAAGSGDTDHGVMGGLGDDDHTQYALLAGRSGGQSLIGGTGASDDLTLQATSNTDPGFVMIGDKISINDTSGLIGIGSSTSPATEIDITGTGQMVTLRADGQTARYGAISAGDTNNAFAPGFRFLRSAGTLSVPTKTKDGNHLATIIFQGYSANTNPVQRQAGQLLAFAQDTWGDTTATSLAFKFEVSSLTGGTVSACQYEESGSVHVQPVGDADVELEVSDGSTQGAGTIHRATSSTHSSRALKSDIRTIQLLYQTMSRTREACNDIKALDPVEFRYKKAQTRIVEEIDDDGVGISRREFLRDRAGRLVIRDDTDGKLWEGYIYEDAPDSITGDHEDIVIDKRIMNLELALKEIISALEGRNIL